MKQSLPWGSSGSEVKKLENLTVRLMRSICHAKDKKLSFTLLRKPKGIPFPDTTRLKSDVSLKVPLTLHSYQDWQFLLFACLVNRAQQVNIFRSDGRCSRSQSSKVGHKDMLTKGCVSVHKRRISLIICINLFFEFRGRQPDFRVVSFLRKLPQTKVINHNIILRCHSTLCKYVSRQHDWNFRRWKARS